MRNPLWVFYDTVSGQRQLYQYRFQTEVVLDSLWVLYDIVSKGSDIIPLPDRASYITTVTHRGSYMKNPLWVLYNTVSRQRQLCQYLYQTEAIVLIPFPDKDSCINTVTTQRQLYRQLYEDLCVGLL